MANQPLRGAYQQRGDAAEHPVANPLRAKGYEVQDLNAVTRNHPIVDLRVTGAAASFLVSVKSCWSANRQIRLGTPKILEQLPDNAFVMILLPAAKGQTLVLDLPHYHLWIVPALSAKQDALGAHFHYAAHSPRSAGHSVMVKDKVDRNVTTRSGAVFQDWQARFREAWHLLPAASIQAHRPPALPTTPTP